MKEQSLDIAQGIHGYVTKKPKEIGVGDHGHLFGYTIDEIHELMLLTLDIAKLIEVR